MSLVVGEGITHEFGPQAVLRAVGFRVGEGERIGVVGPNGGGKTTLLRIVLGEIDPTFGEVHRRKNLVAGYLPQEPPAPSGLSVRGAMLEVFAGLRAEEAALAELEKSLPSGGEAALRRYGAAQAAFEHAGGYDYRRRIERVLEGLRFPPQMRERPLAELSGGERTRAHLAGLLLREPDLLLLDEPTNHLDIDAVEWLEGWLDSFGGALVAVSHDRYFLDRVTTRTWEVADGGMEAYRGNYSHYVRQREERHLARTRLWEEQQAYILKTQDFIRRYHASQRSKESQGRQAHLDRFLEREAIERPRSRERIRLRLPEPERAGDFVLRARGLVAGYGAPLLEAGDLEIMRGQKIAVIGPNGGGKTTFLRTLLGQLAPLAGEVRPGARVRFGYLSQTHAELDPELDAVDNVRAAAPALLPGQIRTLLGSLLVSGDEALKKVRDLSGGQRSRVILARLIVQDVNVLMLDEPTNHLDIPSAEVIQETLSAFPGTVVLVSHDRYLVQTVATDVWAIAGGRLRRIRGGWAEYLAWRGAPASAPGAGAGAGGAGPAGADPGEEFRRARREANRQAGLRRSLEKVEARIEALEQELAGLDARISAAGEAGRVGEVGTLGAEYAAREAELKELWARWEELGAEIG